jgi:biotin carboxyl carrier protein
MLQEINVSAEKNGRVADISVAPGDVVEKGDMLLRIEPLGCAMGTHGSGF